MTSDGDIRNGAYAGRAKEYVWSTVRDLFPRGITPTDIDSFVEVNWCFFMFEGKTEGAVISKGQGMAFRRAMLRWPAMTSLAVVGEHPELDRVDVSRALTRIRCGWSIGKALRWTRWLPGDALGSLIIPGFVRDAQADRRLEPEAWVPTPDTTAELLTRAEACVSCGETPARLWPVPESQHEDYGTTAHYCELCEPFTGGPLSDWGR